MTSTPSTQPQTGTQQQEQLTTELIQKYLDENQQLILAILENQNIGRLEECIQYSARLQQNLKYLATIADSQPQATGLMYPPMYNYNQAALMPQMPLMPQTPPQMMHGMDMLQQQFPLTVPLPQQKDKGQHWTTEEHQRFLAALELFGPKDIKRIADYVGTRTQAQVRSHLQKHQQKLTRVIGRYSSTPSTTTTSGSTKRGPQLVITSPASPFPQFNTPVTPQHFTPQTPILIPSTPASPIPLSPLPSNTNYSNNNNTNIQHNDGNP